VPIKVQRNLFKPGRRLLQSCTPSPKSTAWLSSYIYWGKQAYSNISQVQAKKRTSLSFSSSLLILCLGKVEGTKHKFSFFQEKVCPTANSTTACTPSSVEGVHKGYHNQWQPQLLGHVPLQGGLCSVSDIQARDFKPWSHSPPGVISAYQ